MEDLQRIEISASPGYPDVVRKVAVWGKNEDYVQRTVTLVCHVEHYSQEGERLNAFRALEREPVLLVASDESQVNPATGKLVAKGTANAVPQFAFLKGAIEAGANQFSIIEAAVLEADSLKRFN